MMDTVEPWLTNLMNKESFLKTHSHYKGVRLSHKGHGICALYRLGATEQFIQKYIEVINKVVPAYDEAEELTEPLEIDYLKSDKLSDYLGKNQGFYKTLALYTDLYEHKYEKDIMRMVKDVCKDLLDGPLYSAFHGVIHLAYGKLGGSDQVMLEAISALHFQYSPFYFLDDHPNLEKRKDLSKFGNGTTPLLDVLESLRKDKEFVEQIYQENIKDTQLRKDTHMYGVFAWSGIKYHSDMFMDLADSLQLPQFFDKSKKDMKQISKLIDWWLDQVTYLYASSEIVNDFFILHGVTAAYSSKHVLPLFDFDTALLSFRSMIASVLVVFVQQHAPKLGRKPEEFYQGEINEDAWKKLIQSVLDDDDIYESHVYKIIQCMHESWMENPQSDFVKYYFAAANIVKNHDYQLRDFSVKNKKLD